MGGLQAHGVAPDGGQASGGEVGTHRKNKRRERHSLDELLVLAGVVFGVS